MIEGPIAGSREVPVYARAGGGGHRVCHEVASAITLTHLPIDGGVGLVKVHQRSRFAVRLAEEVYE